MAPSRTPSRWPIVAALLLLAALLAPAARPGRAEEGSPTLTLSADAGRPGDAVTARGKGFPARTTVRLVLLPDGLGLATGETRGTGRFRERFAVPDVAPGDHVVVATVGDRTAEAPFRVTGADEAPPSDASAPPADQPVETAGTGPAGEERERRRRRRNPAVLDAASQPQPAAAAATTLAFAPEADAYVDAAYPTTNFGARPSLFVDGGADPAEEAYLRFRVDGGAGSVQRATLRLRTTNAAWSATVDGPAVHPAANGWTEAGLTWETRPARGGAVGDVGALAGDTWAEWDVTPLVAGNGTFTFVLAGSSADAVEFHAREGVHPPQLLVAFDGGSPPPTATPPAGTGPRTIRPAADARVEAASPGANFGADPRLRVDAGGDPEVRTYLRFAVSGVGPARRATLRLWATSGTTDGPAVYVAGNGWTEKGITYNTRPAQAGGALADAGSVAGGAWMALDVTAAVPGDGTYTFVLVGASTDEVDFSAREGERPPQLVLDRTGGAPPTATATPTRTPTPSPPPAGGVVTVAAAGDVACDPDSGSFNDGNGTSTACRQKSTADLVRQLDPDLVLMLGDMQYEYGYAADIAASYHPSWGAFRDKTLAVAGGSHDFYGGGDFYAYWGTRAGPGPRRNWFSHDLANGWHVVLLNSYCPEVGGCDPGSPQYEWLRADLAASTADCTVALWHEPRYSSGYRHGDEARVDPLWDLLWSEGAELVLVGHEHNYERFAPLDASGARDDATGLRQIVVGTGGKSLETAWGTIKPHSEARQRDTYGVLELELSATGYKWAFVPEAGKTYRDSGSTACHGAPGSAAMTAALRADTDRTDGRANTVPVGDGWAIVAGRVGLHVVPHREEQGEHQGAAPQVAAGALDGRLPWLGGLVAVGLLLGLRRPRRPAPARGRVVRARGAALQSPLSVAKAASPQVGGCGARPGREGSRPTPDS